MSCEGEEVDTVLVESSEDPEPYDRALVRPRHQGSVQCRAHPVVSREGLNDLSDLDNFDEKLRRRRFHDLIVIDSMYRHRVVAAPLGRRVCESAFRAAGLASCAAAAGWLGRERY